MTQQLTESILITQTDEEDIYCFMLVIATDEGVLTLRFHALELVQLVHGIQLELLDWFANTFIAALEAQGQTEAAELLKKLREGS